MWQVTTDQILAYRLRAHHLDREYEAEDLLEAAGAAGFQNTPPGVWEQAAKSRIPEINGAKLKAALYEEKTLMQAWSYRGVPLVFPTSKAETFLSGLAAKAGEEWIYTKGIGLVLDHLQMGFDQCLNLLVGVTGLLDSQVVESKRSLDRILAAAIEEKLDDRQRELWRDPSMYGADQTVGEAAVSFLLRPCSMKGLVVFGERKGSSPTFTSMKNWVGETIASSQPAAAGIAEKFLHCYGPANSVMMSGWLGCSPAQARRLFSALEGRMTRVHTKGRSLWMLSEDVSELSREDCPPPLFRLLPPHDPYLDLRDRERILDKKYHREVWKTVGNPGVVLKGGRIAGIWRSKSDGGRVEVDVTLWEECNSQDRRAIERWLDILLEDKELSALRYR